MPTYNLLRSEQWNIQILSMNELVQNAYKCQNNGNNWMTPYRYIYSLLSTIFNYPKLWLSHTFSKILSETTTPISTKLEWMILLVSTCRYVFHTQWTQHDLCDKNPVMAIAWICHWNKLSSYFSCNTQYPYFFVDCLLR